MPVKYWLWVKEIDCEACGEAVPLFPGYLLAENVRHSQNVLVCSGCGELNEVENPLARRMQGMFDCPEAKRSSTAGALSLPEVSTQQRLSATEKRPTSASPICA